MDPDSYLCRLADLFDGVVVTPPSVGAVIAIVLAVVLLFASGFVSASEIAFFSLTPNDLNDIEEENHSSDKYIKSLLKDSERLLATILISNNFVNVTIIMLCNFFFANVIDFGSSVVFFDEHPNNNNDKAIIKQPIFKKDFFIIVKLLIS